MAESSVDTEELRFAVVLNGGVSLAIWMGGATHELNRLTHGVGAYGKLLKWAKSHARVDVISGTSAGGINGAALALAQANGADDGQSLGLLRDVWLNSGSLQNLLREPFEGSAPSLLNGDGFFLPQIGQALRRLTEPYDPLPAEQHPIDLTITATLLRGIQGVVRDHTGERVGQVRHDGLFRFRRGPTHPQSRGGTAPTPGDDFTTEEIEKSGGTVDALALAARTTASYPVAFEPSYLPARADDAKQDVTSQVVRPNLAPYLSGAWEDPQEGGPRSRYGVDGGVLANTPTRPALDAINAMPASGAVRRVLLIVHPHAPPPMEDEHESADDPPTLVETGAGLLKAITSEGSRNFVDLIRQHNERAATRRDMRADVVARFPPSGDGADQLRREAIGVYGLYRRLRLRELSHRLTATWLGRPTAPTGAATAATGAVGKDPANAESVRPIVLRQLEELTDPRSATASPEANGSSETPTQPRLLPPERNFLRQQPDLSSDPEGFPMPAELGIDGALGIADVAVDYLRRVMWWSMQNDTELAQLVREARSTVSLARNGILELRREGLELCAATAASATTQGPQPWASATVQELAARCEDLNEPLNAIAEAVTSARVSWDAIAQDGPQRISTDCATSPASSSPTATRPRLRCSSGCPRFTCSRTWSRCRKPVVRCTSISSS